MGQGDLLSDQNPILQIIFLRHYSTNSDSKSHDYILNPHYYKQKENHYDLNLKRSKLFTGWTVKARL